MYTSKVIGRFRNPQNYGKIEGPDGVGKVGNIICGDVMWLYIKVAKAKEGNEVIEDLKFETFGCVAAIATSDIIADLAKGKTLSAALKIDKGEVVKSLGELPPVKIHCSVLAADALYEAVYDYLSRNRREIPKDLQKHHDRIDKEKKIIEKKYRDWTKAEEEMRR